jgi:hypothetical protein
MGLKSRILLVVAIALVLAQLLPVARRNPPVEEEVPADPAVRAILQRACYDCHSNEVVWPWYAYVAPASWFVAADVNEARARLNFSTWNRYSAEKRARDLAESWAVVRSGAMPLDIYLPLNPQARLNESDRLALREWAQREARSAGPTQR